MGTETAMKIAKAEPELEVKPNSDSSKYVKKGLKDGDRRRYYDAVVTIEVEAAAEVEEHLRRRPQWKP